MTIIPNTFIPSNLQLENSDLVLFVSFIHLKQLQPKINKINSFYKRSYSLVVTLKFIMLWNSNFLNE